MQNNLTDILQRKSLVLYFEEYIKCTSSLCNSVSSVPLCSALYLKRSMVLEMGTSECKLAQLVPAVGERAELFIEIPEPRAWLARLVCG